MKNRKVLNLRTAVGGLLGKTSYDSVKHNAEMELWPIGVFLKSVEGRAVNLLIWGPNIVECMLAPEDELEEKRGPGRPPGPRAA